MTMHTALILGDNSSFYIYLSNLFQRYGYQCKIPLDGSLSNDRLLTLKPDFIILDLPLRSAPSLQTIKQLGDIVRLIRTRTLIMAPELLLQRSDLQFADVRLPKPVSAQQLETVVVSLLSVNRISDSAPSPLDRHIQY